MLTLVQVKFPSILQKIVVFTPSNEIEQAGTGSAHIPVAFKELMANWPIVH